MPDSDLDEKLRRFLEHNAQDQRLGNTIAHACAQIHQLEISLRGLNSRVVTLESGHEETINRLDSHGAAIVAIKRYVRKTQGGEDDPEMSTGTYDLGAIRKEVEAARRRESLRVRAETENVVWWKRSIIMWLVGGLGAVAVTLITALVTLAIANSSTRTNYERSPIQQERK